MRKVFFGLGFLVLGLGFLLSNCGSGPQVKTLVEKGAYAIEFPGIVADANYIGVGEGEDMSNSDVTVEAWVKVPASGEGIIFVRGTGIFLFVEDNVAKFRAESTTVSSSTNVNDDTWHHVAGVVATTHNHTDTTTCTVNARSGLHVDIYVDGVWEDCNGPLDDYPAGVGVECDDAHCANNIGRNLGAALAAGSIFKGIIDEVRLWKEARTANQINEWKSKEITAENWKQANPYGKLVGYWRFNQGAGSTAPDSSGFGNSGSKLRCVSDCGATDEVTVPWKNGWVAGYPF